MRGPLASMPALGDGEFYLALDYGQLYVGFGGGALKVGNQMAVPIQDSAGNALTSTASALDVNIKSDSVTLPVSAAALPLPAGASTAANQASEVASLASIDTKTPALVSGRSPVDGSGVTQPVVQAAGSSVSIGSATGKTNVLKTGNLTTTAVTANQVVLTYTVTAGKTLYLEYIDIAARLTAPSATASVLGTLIIQIGGVTVYTASFVNPTTSDAGSQAVRISVGEPIPIAAAVVVSFLTTPAAVTSMLWSANFVGYEK